MQIKTVKSQEIQYNWNSFNSLRNTFNLRVVNEEFNFPKHLLICAKKEFERLAKYYHIDPDFYPYVEIIKWDGTYQVDFKLSPMNSAGFSLYHIYYDSKNKKILQARFSLNN